MGKALRWFRSLLSSKKSPESSQATKKKQSKLPVSNSSTTSIKFSNHVEDPRASPYVDGLDANKHAIAVAAATAAVAEAALAAAQAAAQVVRLTSGGGNGSGRSAPYSGGDRRALWAAVKIQSAFRAYLARRALRALKGLVKLQALVRGHIVRRQSSDMLHRMQTMARIQARASAHRFYSECSNTKIKFYNSHYQGATNLRKYEERSNSTKHGGSLLKQNLPRSNIGNSVNKETSHLASRWLNHWMEQSTWNSIHDTSLENRHVDDERSDKILEIDTWKPHKNTRRKDQTVPKSHYFSAWSEMEQDYTKVGPSRLSSKLQKPNPSISSEEVPSLISSKFPPEGDQVATWTAENSPRLHSASSRPTGNLRGPFTPARSECSRSLFGDYLGHPSYMANTESSRAKVRSHSAPKQRVQFEELGKFGHGIWDSDAISEMGCAFPANRRSNAYLYAGQVKRQVNTTRDGATGFSSIYERRI